MKLAVIMVLFSISSLAASPDLALYNAATYGAEAKVCLRVVNQDGKPVPDATIKGGMTTGGGVNDYSKISGHTDGDGLFVIEGKCTDFIRCNIGKEGYYASEFKYVCYKKGVSPAVVDGKWQPYGATISVTLKQIMNPFALGGCVEDLLIPTFDKWIGFDLQIRDWVAPHGKGVSDDVLIRYSCDRRGRLDFNCKIELSFENWPSAGVCEMRKDTFSEMKNVYFAPTNGQYEKTVSYEKNRTANRRVIMEQLGENEYLVFRTRTTLDSNGKLIGAHYGRIDGPFIFGPNPTITIGGVFFNETENDNNIEDKATAERSIKDSSLRKKLEDERNDMNNK